MDDEADNPWFSAGMTKEEKSKARKTCNLSVIVKLVGKNIGYHYFLHRLQTLRRPQCTFSLIDLPNGFFIAKFSHQADYEVALSNEPWMVSDHYLHIQWWVPKFIADDAQIIILPL